MDSIQNIVSTCKISEKIINLQETAKNIPNSYYTPNKFNAVVIKHTDPKATTMLFNSGRLVCTDSKHMPDNKLACEKTAFLLGTHYISEYSIQKRVCVKVPTGVKSMKEKLGLEKIILNLSTCAAKEHAV